MVVGGVTDVDRTHLVACVVRHLDRECRAADCLGVGGGGAGEGDCSIAILLARRVSVGVEVDCLGVAAADRRQLVDQCLHAAKVHLADGPIGVIVIGPLFGGADVVAFADLHAARAVTISSEDPGDLCAACRAVGAGEYEAVRLVISASDELKGCTGVGLAAVLKDVLLTGVVALIEALSA